MAFVLPDLPFAHDALEPIISARTFEFHHDKHHKAYVDTTNQLLADQGRSPATLEEVVRASEGKLFNQSAQAWNHGFQWESLSPDGGRPCGDLASAIDAAFGSLDGLKDKFVTEGVGHFASGWVWLVAKGNGGEDLAVISTHDAGTAITQDGVTPLLVVDVWEHAYYLDHQNLRKAYLEKVFDGALNWAFAARQYDAARGRGMGYGYPAPTA